MESSLPGAVEIHLEVHTDASQQPPSPTTTESGVQPAPAASTIELTKLEQPSAEKPREPIPGVDSESHASSCGCPCKYNLFARALEPDWVWFWLVC